ncbi:hypothetical protein GFY24_11550 [Nocardia sp. SYP-A9097]|uniref:hypothetical protein n=1 Tax=Nocardia sp. SYP-A9097 TaxID=2663237 RepID=UPI00129B94A3|nr:hypothetical protein [Nocardia sp. SYP-A9097]MRH88069.1 hypothetical protein [Nocardia sp. SYP-A9097]
MSDQELPETGGNTFDAVERLRRKLEALKAAETTSPEAGPGNSKLIRLPRRPRRMTDQPSAHPHQPWRSEGTHLHDPEPTRPVLRSELQRETGWWPLDPSQTPPPAPGDNPRDPEHDSTVIDLAALRRKRAGDDAPAASIKRMAKPRRISPATEPNTDGGQNGYPDSQRPDGSQT